MGSSCFRYRFFRFRAWVWRKFSGPGGGSGGELLIKGVNNMNGKSKMAGKGSFDVTRKIPLANSAREKWADAARQLLVIEPIHEAKIDQHGQLRIRYDASCIGIRDIEKLLDELEIARTSGVWWRMKLGWYGYVDENARINAYSSGGACCNRPPSVYGGGRGTEKTNEWHIHD